MGDVTVVEVEDHRLTGIAVTDDGRVLATPDLEAVVRTEPLTSSWAGARR